MKNFIIALTFSALLTPAISFACDQIDKSDSCVNGEAKVYMDLNGDNEFYCVSKAAWFVSDRNFDESGIAKAEFYKLKKEDCQEGGLSFCTGISMSAQDVAKVMCK